MKRKRLWAAVITIVLLSTLGIAVLSNQGEAVAVTGVMKGAIKKYVEDIGIVKCKSRSSVSIEGSGLIQVLPVDVGQQVKKGDLLLGMEKSQLEIQLKILDEKINEVKAGFEGSEIKNYASSVEKARIAVSRTKDAYERALEEAEDARLLAQAGAMSREELKQRESALDSAKALMDTAGIDLQQIEANTPDSVRAVYKAQMGQLIQNRESILHSIGKQELTAPIDGIILERNVELNTVGVPGTVGFVIGDVRNVEVESGILADEVANIGLGDEVEITERSDNKQTISGRVSKIAPSAIAVMSSLGVNQRKVLITIEPAECSELLKPGYEVDVRIITDSKTGVVRVPVSSVFEYKGKDRVFVVSDGKAILREVRKGIQDEDHVEILEGLKEGELVLTEPDTNIKEGMRIKPSKNPQ